MKTLVKDSDGTSDWKSAVIILGIKKPLNVRIEDLQEGEVALEKRAYGLTGSSIVERLKGSLRVSSEVPQKFAPYESEINRLINDIMGDSAW